MRVQKRKLYKKITLLKYNAGVHAALYLSKVILGYMATKTQSLAHTKWLCKYHIVFTPKYRCKVIYNQYRNSLREILRRLCEYKGVKIIEEELMADHVYASIKLT